MLSLRRLVYVLLMVLGICGIFILYNINEETSETISLAKENSEALELLSGEPVDKTREPHFYVVGDKEKELYQDIYHNVCQMMENLKVSWSSPGTIDQEQMKDSRAVLVFCDDTLSPYVDLPLLAEFVEKGGRVILAAGLAEGYEESYLSPVFGIREKSIKENYLEYCFAEGFFPLQDERMTYDGFNASTCLKVQSEAEVYVEDAQKHIPIVYSYSYGEGASLVINATFLNDRRCMGFLVGGIGCLLGEFVYPVLGTECVCLNDFPDVTNENDSLCMRLYGRTTEALVRDVVWPVFQEIAVNNEIHYTAYLSTDASNEGLSRTLGKYVLRYDGEVISMSETSVMEEVMDMEEGNFSGMDMTSGIDLDNGNFLVISSVLTSHGMVAHTFPVNQLIGTDENQPGWDTNRQKLDQYEKQIFSRIGYLQKITQAEAPIVFKSYEALEYTWKKNKNGLELSASHFAKGQSFFVHTKDRIREAEGAEYEKIGENYYIVRLKSCNAVLQYE